LDDTSKVVFQIYTEVLDDTTIDPLCQAIEQNFPDALYFGCSTSGNIVDCELSENVTVVCTIFEDPTTQIKLLQYDLHQQSVDSITKAIVDESKRNPWVKAVEMYFTIPEGSSTSFCEGLKGIDPNVKIFGGVSCSDDITSDDCCVFSKVGECSDRGIVVVFYGGEDFYVDAIKITGWKPLGRKFIVTKSEGCVLQELDGIPAYDVYNKYLNINNDENFFYNTLEFPLFYEHNDTTILRVPVASNPDGSITMSSDINVGSVVRISYGDPKTIVASIEEDSKKIREFHPDVVHIFSCAARRTFWNQSQPTYEIYPFKDIASSVGFFSHGEFIRENDNLNQHNVTLVISAMREGKDGNTSTLDTSTEEKRASSKVPLVSRFATFISATSLELEETNNRLELINEKLKQAVIIDGLTGLYNRKEIQSRIEENLANVKNEKFSIVMFDIDNFKQVNDNYGHQEGDTVIISLANILRNRQAICAENFSAGRWGGEEFMLLLNDTSISTATFIAELVRQCFANTNYPKMRSQTVSVGVTQARLSDTVDTLCTRVDTALYKAKKTGKNRVVVI
jgi:diguanylate cyclase (GGDEF)-like protein